MIRHWLGYIALLLWFLMEIRNLAAQTQIAFFGGTLLAPAVVFKVALLLTLVLAAFTARGRLRTSKMLIVWAIFVVYLLFHMIYLAVRFSYPLDYIIFNYNTYFFHLLILPLMFTLRGSISERTIVFWLMFLFVPLAVLGVAQAILNDTIIPTESADVLYGVNQVYREGATRAISLFSSASEFGDYITLVGALGVVLLLGRGWNTKLIGSIFIALVAAAGIATLTRGTYMQIPMAMGTAYLLVCYKGAIVNRLLLFLPIIYGLVSAFVVFVLPFSLAASRPDSSILSEESILTRYQLWSQATEVLLGDDAVTTSLGTGLVQNPRFSDVVEFGELAALFRTVESAEYFQVDNGFLAVWINVGLLGLLLWLALMWMLWRYVLSAAIAYNSTLAVAVAAAWSTWIATSMFSNNLSAYSSLVLLLLLGLGRGTQRDRGGQGAVRRETVAPSRRRRAVVPGSRAVLSAGRTRWRRTW